MVGSGTLQNGAVFAPNQNVAEAGGSVPAVLRSKTIDRENAILDDSARTEEDGPFSQYCTDNAPIWKLYMDQARIADDNLANIFNSDLDPLLIFAGLFSAILSAFLIEIRKGLQEDLQNITNNLLLFLIENQHDITGPQIPAFSRFEPTSSSRWVNGLWFSSLMFSLMSALGASLAKGWITQFSAAASGSTWRDAAVHCSRFRGLKRWQLKIIIQGLPSLIHIAFFLFSIGLVVLIFQDDAVIGVVIAVLTGIIVALYVVSSIHPAFSVDSPFRTPLSGILRRLSTGSWRLEEVAPFPSQKEAQKAQALTWLVAESPNSATINAAIRAIAGLPVTTTVQDELLTSTTVTLLSGILASECAKPSPDPESLNSALYALLHLVQTAPAKFEDTNSLGILQGLVADGPLAVTNAMPPGIREIAMCVSGRVILLLRDDIWDSELFDVQIPVLVKSCGDTHLRRQLFQIILLARPPVLSPQASQPNFRAILSDGNAKNRIDIHSQLVKASISGTHITDRVTKFGAQTLITGLTTGSTELRRRYAELFAELATDAAFRNEMTLRSGRGIEICSLLQAEDDDFRQHIVTALTCVATDDRSRTIITEGFGPVITTVLDKNPPVFGSITGFLLDVACHDDIRKIVVDSGIISLLITRAHQAGQKRALHIIETLATYADIWGPAATVHTVDYLLGLCILESGPNPRAMEIMVKLSQHDAVRRVIAAPAPIESIISMLDHNKQRIQRSAHKAFASLVQYHEFRAAISTPEIIQRVMAILTRCRVQKSAIETIVALMAYNDVRGLAHTSKILENLISMFESLPNQGRESLLPVVLALVRHYDVRVGISMAGTLRTIFELLSTTAPETAVNILIALAEYTDVRAVISTPETIGQVMRMLQDTNSYIRKLMLKVIFPLMMHVEVRSALLMAGALERVIAMLGEPGQIMADSARDAVIALAQYDEVRTILSAPDTILTLNALLGHPQWHVEQSALHAITGLAQHDEIRVALATVETIHKIVMMLDDPAREAQQSGPDHLFRERKAMGLRAIVALARYDDVRTAIVGPETMQKILTIFWEHSTLQQLAMETVIILAEYDDIHAITLIPETIRGFLWVLQSPMWEVRQSANEAIMKLAEHDGFRAAISPDVMQEMVTMLKNPAWGFGNLTLKTVVALVVYDDVRLRISTPETLGTIDTILGDPTSDVRKLALETLIGLLQHKDVLSTISVPDTIDKIMRMLRDTAWHVRQFAISTFITLARYTHDEQQPNRSPGHTVGILISMQRDLSWDVRKYALEGLVSLLEYEDIRAALVSRPDGIQQITKMLEDPVLGVQKSALEATICLMKHDDLSPAVSTPEIIQRIIAMLGDSVWDLRQLIPTTIVALTQHASVRAEMSTPETMEILIQMLVHHHSDVRHLTLGTVCRLVQHNDIRAAILTPAMIKTIIMTLGDPNFDVRQSAFEAVGTLVGEVDVLLKIITPDTIRKIASFLGVSDPNLRDLAHTTVINISHYDEARALISAPENFPLIINLLGDLNADVRKSGFDTLVSLTRYSEICEAISKPDTMQSLLKLLDDTEWILQSGLEIFLSLADHDNIRAAMIVLDIVPKLFSALGDSDAGIRDAASLIVGALSTHDDVCTAMSSPEAVHQLSGFFGHANPLVGEDAIDCAITLLRYERFKISISSAHSVVSILSRLNGGTGDTNILRLLSELLPLGDNVSSAVLNHVTLESLIQMQPAARKSYRTVLGMLPVSAIIIPADNADELVGMLHNPDPDIVQSAIQLLSHFSSNVQFRQHVLDLAVKLWPVTVRLLQHNPTAKNVLNMIKNLAQYDDAREQILQSSGIVHQLLNMLNDGTTDIDRWQLGIKGLLALGIFE